ncbi:YheC/YheD family protein [Alteribacter aurantiacus]|uniref:YheC/YheD family endospore coat-associated protein n=1 Tax=Alteribacter aurantiacus TaxID=254410 RepID=UPI000407F3B4|nr:YheC/YheD family protein [Alteribacter aurantiacus]
MSFIGDQTTVRFHFDHTERAPNQVTISKSFASRYFHQEEKEVTLSIGSWEEKVLIAIDSNLSDETMVLSPSLFPFDGVVKADTFYYLKIKEGHAWHIGPLVAMLLNEGHLDREEPFGHLTSFSDELADYAKKSGAMFVVIPLNHQEASDLKGFYQKDGMWRYGPIPFPDVVYNRLSTPEKENSKKGKKLFGLLKEKNIPFFNDRFIHKWEMHQLLFQHAQLRPYLPDTVLSIDRERFLTFTKMYKQLYIKPIWGREGNGILRMTCHDHSLEAEYPSDTIQRTFHFRSFDHFYKTLEPRFKEKGYVVQEAIPLFTVDGSLVDIRVLTIKNGKGEWEVASKIARCGVKNQIVSNVAKGGEQRKVLDTLEGAFPELHVFHLIRFLNELAIETAQTIEEELGESGCYGEFGIDIGIDNNGHPWILEVNSKPSKSYDTPDQDKVRPSVKKLLSFGHYLSGLD